MDRVKPVNISKEMRSSFLEYAMSVIVSRALPDVRDGLKPVHRRILYGMHELGMYSDKAYKKSARIVGEVMGKYHPHGDSAIYDTMVRMAQDFSYRHMLVDGHGNFGSIDGDGAAAMRYTEARMSKISMELLRDIKKETIDYRDNYDGSEQEPIVLPSRFPNLLVNGATGIAVGMATNIPPHNLGEVIDGTIALMKNSELEIADLMDIIQGPDFPTGGTILGRAGIKQAYLTGKGSIVTRAKTEIQEMKNGKFRILVTEIPYQVNKARLIEKIAELVRDKKIDGITDLRDETNREGIRIVIELRRDVNANVILNNLYKHTQLQTTFGVNNLSLVNNIPKVLTLKETLQHYIDFQVEVITRRTIFDLKKAEARAHLLEGLIIALDHIDEVIRIIRGSETDQEALLSLIDKFNLSEIQAKAILDMRLRRLTGLERDKIQGELNDLKLLITDLKDILENIERVFAILEEELNEIKDKYADPRRSAIDDTAIEFIDDESLIPEEDIVITLTNKGYIKRLPADTYRTQNRGGRGVKGMNTNEEDFVEHLLSTSTHSYVLFFTNKGKVYRLKGYEVPSFSRTSKGIPVINLIPVEKDEVVNTIIKVDDFNEDAYFAFATKLGLIKRTHLSEFESIRSNGKVSISLRDDDELISVRRTNGDQHIVMGASNGKLILFDEKDARPMGRAASGVRGILLEESESVVGMEVVHNFESERILVVSENGYGKQTPLKDYRVQNRGGKGVITLNITDKNGQLVSLKTVDASEDLMIITTNGIIIRLPIEQVSSTGRATQGVRLIRLDDDQYVTTVAKIANEGGEIVDEEAE